MRMPGQACAAAPVPSSDDRSGAVVVVIIERVLSKYAARVGRQVGIPATGRASVAVAEARGLDSTTVLHGKNRQHAKNRWLGALPRAKALVSIEDIDRARADEAPRDNKRVTAWVEGRVSIP